MVEIGISAVLLYSTFTRGGIVDNSRVILAYVIGLIGACMIALAVFGDEYNRGHNQSYGQKGKKWLLMVGLVGVALTFLAYRIVR